MTSRTTPMTLRELAGLRSIPTPLAESTLVVIDAQRAYSSTGALALPDIGLASSRVGELITEARRRDVPVVHVAHVSAPGSPFDPEDGGRFLDRALPLPGETVIEKSLPNAFAGTVLGEHLNGLGRPLLICGFMTHMCVASTARAALDLGWETNIASDATATRALPGPDSSASIPAASIQAATLAALADRFSVVAPTSTFTTAGSHASD